MLFSEILPGVRIRAQWSFPLQVLILLLAICNLPDLMKAARQGASLDPHTHALGNSEAWEVISQEVLAKSREQTGKLYGLFCLVWAAFLHITDMLPEAPGKPHYILSVRKISLQPQAGTPMTGAVLLRFVTSLLIWSWCAAEACIFPFTSVGFLRLKIPLLTWSWCAAEACLLLFRG